MSIKELAKICNVSQARVYQLASLLGRVPTQKELLERKGKAGRPNDITNNKLLKQLGKTLRFKDLEKFTEICKNNDIKTIEELVEIYRG